MCTPKRTSHNFLRWLLCFRMLWCTFTRFNSLFWPFTWFRNIVVNPCFIYHHKLTQKFFWIAVKIGQIFLRNGHPNAFLVDFEQSRYPSCTELSDAQIYMLNFDGTLSWDGYNVNYLTRYHFRVIQKHIMDFIEHFWCSDLIWTTWTWYGLST